MGFLSSATSSLGGSIGQALSAVVGLGSDLIGTGVNAYANHREADLNRDWQERMAKNAYQYRIEDLKASGLNPVLATGQNVSVPSGATATGNPANFSNAGRLMNTMLENQMKQSQRMAESQIVSNNALAAKSNAEAVEATARAEKVKAETSQIPTLSPLEVNNEEKRKNATWLENLARGVVAPFLGTLNMAERLGANQVASPRELAERSVDQILAVPGSHKIDSGKRAEMIRIAERVIRREREAQFKRGEKTVKEGGIKHPTGRSVLY